jgi:hypothetical protein
MTDRDGFPLYILMIVCCLFVALPFVLTKYPPITDLPQQAAQIRLFLETLEAPAQSTYKIQWFTPYSLSYLILGSCWALFGPINAGRAAMLVIGLLWVVSIQLTALKRKRAISSAILACVLFFNHNTYWGFYSFAIGLPAVLLWNWVIARTESVKFCWKEAMLWLGAGLLLYTSHVLWFAAGVCWFILRSLVFGAPLGRVIVRLACIVPFVVITIVWFPALSASKMATPPLWVTGLTSRISWAGITDAVFGGLRGPTEGLVFGAVLVWLITALWQHRRELRSAIDWELMLAATMFLVMGLVFPDKFMNTIRFWQRWLPAAAVMLVLAVPAPSLQPVWRQAVALAIVAAFCLASSGKWRVFERVELSGLQESLAELPKSPKLLGLDMVKRSKVIRGRPFIQIAAYSQVLKGGELNFSFAEFAPCLVVYKDQHGKPWTGGLDWYAERLKYSDFEHFDFALVNGNKWIHDSFRAIPALTPMTRHGRWRLYGIVRH